MAMPADRNSDSLEQFHALSRPGARPAHLDNNLAPPVHPIFSLQGAFEESIVESTQEDPLEALVFDFALDARMRRRQLLDAERFEDGWSTKWKNAKSSKHHPFLKLMAQIVFGMHLLEQDQAKSTAEVVAILQGHVNQVDSFLERTNEDFTVAIKDIEERIRYLRMPMLHTDVFDTMLNDKKYRSELLLGNEKVERIAERTVKAMDSAMMDLDCGIQSTAELRLYLEGLRTRFSIGNRSVSEILSAMSGNEQGWTKYLHDLRSQGKHLGDQLLTLTSITNEIARRAGAASRRNVPQGRTLSPEKRIAEKRIAVSPGIRSKFTKQPITHTRAGPWVDKPLPREPIPSAPTPEPVLSSERSSFTISRIEPPRSHAPTPEPGPSKQVSSATIKLRLEPPRSETSPVPRRTASKLSADGSPLRPKPAGHAPGLASMDSTKALAEFLRDSGPLRTHPPDFAVPKPVSIPQPVTLPARTQSQSRPPQTNSHILPKPDQQCRRSISQPILPTIRLPTMRSLSTTKTIPRKPLASTKPEKDMSFVYIEELTSPTIGTGFSPRFSKRVKNLPAPIKSQLPPDLTPKPVDSARFMSPASRSNDNEYSPDETAEKLFSAPTPKDQQYGRQGLRLGLWPKDMVPFASSASEPTRSTTRSRAATDNNRSPPKEFRSFKAGNAPIPVYAGTKGHAAKGGSRTLSLTKLTFWHRKGWSVSSAQGT